MTITDQDFHKMLELVKELHEKYTKSVERENVILRNMLAETEKKLDEAVDALNKIKKTNENKIQHDDLREKFDKLKDVYKDNGWRWAPYPNTNPYIPLPEQITWTSGHTSDISVNGVSRFNGSVSDEYNKFIASYASE